MRDAATRRITRPPEVTTILREIPMDSIADVVVGPRYVGVLFTVCDRLPSILVRGSEESKCTLHLLQK